MQKDKSKKYYEILKSAGAVFASLGFHKATISQIAKETDIADGTIYLYFKNKNDILYQFISYKTEAVFEKMRDAVDEAGNIGMATVTFIIDTTTTTPSTTTTTTTSAASGSFSGVLLILMVLSKLVVTGRKREKM